MNDTEKTADEERREIFEVEDGTTEVGEGVSVEVHVPEERQQSDDYYFITAPIDGRSHEAEWLRDKAMNLHLAEEGGPSVRIALSITELRRLRDAINDEIGPDPRGGDRD